MPGEHLGRRLLKRQVRERAEVRLVLDEGLSRVRVRGDGADLDVGMCGEDPEDLAARIAGCAGDGDRICHGFHLRVWGRGLQTATPTAPLLRGAQGRLESASVQTSARGSDARNERGGERALPKAWADDSRPAAASANRVERGIRAAGPRQASAPPSSASSSARVRPDARSRSRPRVALVGERALERVADAAEPAAGGAVGGVRPRREARHVARQPQRQRARSHPVLDVVAREPLVIGLDDAPVCPAISRASARAARRAASMSPIAFADAVPAARAPRRR